jgi:hypothetical protein
MPAADTPRGRSTVADWVPMRWPAAASAQALGLLRDHPVNCLLVDAKQWSPEFALQAAAMKIAVLKQDGVASSNSYVAADGLRVTFVQRHQMDLSASVAATDQGIWPGVRAQEEGKAHAAASGAAWIDTNAGFLRFVRAAAKPETSIWIGVQPPAGKVFPVERYLQAIGDAAMTGTRWVLAFDDDFSRRLLTREPKALKDWARIGETLRFYEGHPEWRSAKAYSKLAIVQSAESGALVSGGVLDMIAVKHTPVKPVPSKSLDPAAMPAAMEDAQLAVNVDPESLTPEQKVALKTFTSGGGTLLTGPPGWKFPSLKPGQVTLAPEDLEKLDAIWKEMNSMIGRRNLGARLFNVSTMLSNLQITADGKQVLLHLVNYGDYAVESVAVHLLGKYKTARLLQPGKVAPQTMELYDIDEGVGLDIDKVGTVATLVLEP